jgi:hypothetical protein
MRRIFAHPERASAAVAWEPTPPQPTTTTNASRSFLRPSSVRKTLFLASCSRIRSIYQSASREHRGYRSLHTIVIISFPSSCSQCRASLIFFAWSKYSRRGAVLCQLPQVSYTLQSIFVATLTLCAWCSSSMSGIDAFKSATLYIRRAC